MPESISERLLSARYGYFIRKWAMWSVPCAGGLLAWAGANHVMDSFGSHQLLGSPDPVFGVSWRRVLVAFGAVEFLVGCVCLFARKRSLGLGLAAWLGANLLAYRIGLWTMGWPHPWAFVGTLAGTLNISPFWADVILNSPPLYVLIVAGAMLLSESKERRTAMAFSSPKMYCPACGGHITFAASGLGQHIDCPHCQKAITLRRPEERLKVPCYFCKGHIEFPAHAIGTKMRCPHCKMEITLMEPVQAQTQGTV